MPIPTNIRVLLIDDDLADRELARYTLSNADHGMYQTTFSCSLTEAEPFLRSDEFDVLLLDLGLPESYGKETLVAVRKINSTIPIVVLSDLSDEKTASECLDEGAQDYLFKSQLALDTLSRSVRYAIQRQSQQEAICTANQLLEQRNAELAQLCDTAQRFVDNVSHEFRTPLTVITEYVSLLLDGVVGTVELDTDQVRFLQILADRANDLNTMVDDMLDVSKLQAGLLSTWRKNCELSNILRHLRPALETKAAIKDVELEFELDADIPTVFCDDEKLGRVLINLVVNAIKFCGQPGKVRVSACSNPIDREVVISIADNGPGISPEDQEKIFGRFRQLGTKIQSAQKGFGLGLSIAKELVDLNLGQMTLTSTPGKGSTFSFSVPFADPNEVTRRYVSQLAHQNPAEQIALFQICSPREPDGLAESEIDAFLNYVTRPEDILFRNTENDWLCLVPLRDLEPAHYVSRIDEMRDDSNRNRPGHPLPPLKATCLGQWGTGETAQLLSQLDHLIDHERGVYA